MSPFLKILGLIVLSALKFFLAPASCAVAGYSFTETFVITSFGGVLGFMIFLKFGVLIQKAFAEFFKRKEKKVFSKKTRMIVNFKNKYGFWGLVILTPVFFGVPLGAILASAFFGNQKRTIPIFLLSIILWSSLLTYYAVYLVEAW